MKFPIALLLLFSLIAGCGRARDPKAASTGEDHLRDRASILTPAERRMLEKQLDLLERETGVGLHVVTTELETGASIEDYSIDPERPAAKLPVRSSAAEIEPVEGSTPETGTARLVYDLRSGRLRLEIGYALEPVFPDAFIGFLIREHARYLLDVGRPADALLFSIRILRDQIRSARLSGELQSSSGDSFAGYTHGGAGASDRAPLGERVLDPFGQSALPAALSDAGAVSSPLYARAGSSVESAYQHYLAWMAARRFETDLALFTPETRRFLADWPMTPGYLEHVLNKEIGKSFIAIQRENRALYVCTDDPFVAPHFFQKTDAGWQIDLRAEAQEVININGGRFSWTLRDPAKSAWIEPFSDQIVWLSDAARPSDAASRTRVVVRRLRGGDNREATLPASPDSRLEPRSRLERLSRLESLLGLDGRI